MTARTGSTAKPSNQTPSAPPVLTEALAGQILALPRRAPGPRRSAATAELWLQSDASPDGWIRCRIVEAGQGSLLLLADQAPTIAQGTWARLAQSASGGNETEQFRVFPLALHRLAEGGSTPLVIECEIPLDPALVARLTA